MTTRRKRDALDPDVVQPLPELGEECFWCQGTGDSADGWACSSCDGTGWCPWPSGALVIWRPELLAVEAIEAEPPWPALSSKARPVVEAARAFMDSEGPELEEFSRHYAALQQVLPGIHPFWVEWRGWAHGVGLLGEMG